MEGGAPITGGRQLGCKICFCLSSTQPLCYSWTLLSPQSLSFTPGHGMDSHLQMASSSQAGNDRMWGGIIRFSQSLPQPVC